MKTGLALFVTVSMLLAGQALAEGAGTPDPATQKVPSTAPRKARPKPTAHPAPLPAKPTPAPASAATPPTVSPLLVPAPLASPDWRSIADWRPLDAENTLVIDTDKGRIIVELRPEFAPQAVARLKALARRHVYDGLLFHRVIEGFVAQTGNPDNRDGGKSAEPDLPPEFTFRLGADTPRMVAARPDGESAGFIGAQPYGAVDEQRMSLSPDHRITAWGAYCSGVVGLGHGADPASGNSEFFIMRQSTRSLDRGYSAAGRVVLGLSTVRALTVGEPPLKPDRMIRVQVASDMAPADRPALSIMNTASLPFKNLVDRLRAAKGADFSVCDVDVPVRMDPPPAPPPKAKPRRRHAP